MPCINVMLCSFSVAFFALRVISSVVSAECISSSTGKCRDFPCASFRFFFSLSLAVGVSVTKPELAMSKVLLYEGGKSEFQPANANGTVVLLERMCEGGGV